jgi:hypothetical protein
VFQAGVPRAGLPAACRRAGRCDERLRVHSRLLEDSLRDFAEEASSALQAELAAGAEIPFELASTGGRRSRGAGLFMYRSLTARFVRERWRSLQLLDSFDCAVRALEACHGLERYAAARSSGGAAGDFDAGERFGRVTGAGLAGSRSLAISALRAFTEDLFDEQSDFELHDSRFAEAISRLDAAAAAEGASLTIVATLHGVTIVSPEVPLADGLTLAQPQAIVDLPEEVIVEPRPQDGRIGEGPPAPSHLVVVYTDGESDDPPSAAIARGRSLLGDLLTALRLFGDGRISLGPIAWARVEGGPFQAIHLGAAAKRSRPALVVVPEQEDELRAFCSLVSRRMPAGDALAWALHRFELGSVGVGAYDGLSDHLLALQALLDPERRSDGLLASRIAGLCAAPEQRRRTAERVLRAIELEHEVAAGHAVAHAAGIELADELAGWLKALLSDLICGHLDGDVQRLADELLLPKDGSSSETTDLPAIALPGSDRYVPRSEREHDEALEDPLEALAQGILPL